MRSLFTTPTRRARRFTTLAAALIVAAAGVVVTTSAEAAPVTAAADPGPNDDSFYTPPATLPAGAPGDIIRWRQSKAPQFLDTVNSWEVMYLSSDEDGKPNAVTGTILAKKTTNLAAAPIIGFASGTMGGAFRCAPSKMLSIGAGYERPALLGFLESGYAVAQTDYAGYHPNPKTTYITGLSEGRAVIDSIRAGQKLPATKLSTTSKVFYSGYSQGGGAALWAAQLTPDYGKGINLAGVVAGGVPGDLVKVTLGLDGGRATGFLLYALVALNNAYPEIEFNKYLNDKGKAAVADIENSSCTLELLVKYKNTSLEEYTTEAPFEALIAAVGPNKLGNLPINVPVFQYHGSNDDIVQFAQADALHKTYCTKGVNLTWKTYPVDHITGILSGNADGLSFIKDRIADKPVSPAC